MKEWIAGGIGLAGKGFWLFMMAFFGVLARIKNWYTPEGVFDPRTAIIDCSSIPAIVVISGAVGAWQELDAYVVSGIAASAGFVGPEAIRTIILSFIEKRAGIVKK